LYHDLQNASVKKILGGGVLTKTEEVLADSVQSEGFGVRQTAADHVVLLSIVFLTRRVYMGRQPFLLIGLQEQDHRDVFAHKPCGYRQFNTEYIENPKVRMKCELAAAIALLLTARH
jgi:hypothetical protein